LSPLVSAIVPTRNRAERLPGALSSALEQTLSDLEVIVVDDASMDATPDVLAELAGRDARVRIFRNEEALGASAARNIAIRAASGEFLAFLDDDDRWFPDKTEKQLEFLRAHPNVGAVTCFFESFDERVGKAFLHRGPTSYSPRALLWANFPGSILGVVRRSAFETTPTFDEELPTCTDWDYWVRCSRGGGVATMPESLSRVVFHGNSQSVFDDAQRAQGRARFVAKHADEMSEDCRVYHAARGRLISARDESERLRLHVRFLVSLPMRVRRIVALETLSARRGKRAGDPGRGLRTLLRLIEADP